LKKYLGLILFLSFNVHASKVPTLKVRIAKSLTQVSVSGIDLERYIWPKKSMKSFAGAKKIQFNCKSKKLFKRKSPIKLASIKSLTGLVNWEKEKYRGLLHIQTSEKFNGCDIINELSLEDYLSTLLPKEMNSKWPIEALKAQAVAARSYAFYKIETNQVSKSKGYNTNYDIENSEKHQVNGSFFDATRKTVRATGETFGEVLTLENEKLSPIFFHSKCGGKTLTPDQVWRNKLPGYKSVTCPFCHKHGRKNWTHTFLKSDLADSLEKVLYNYKGDKTSITQSELRLTHDSKGSSRIKFYNNSEFKVIKKSRLRSVMGRTTLPSNYYNITEKGNKIEVSGSGFGHGVGMCQFGAKELALKGYSYKQILAHYFPELKLKKIY
jgi:stage II sporulation protein D